MPFFPSTSRRPFRLLAAVATAVAATALTVGPPAGWRIRTGQAVRCFGQQAGLLVWRCSILLTWTSFSSG